MSVEYKGQELSKREAVSVILDENDIDLEPPTSVYADRIANRTPFPEPLDVETLIRYLVASINVVDEDTRRAKRQLEAIIEGNKLDSVGQEDSTVGRITEEESEDIMFGFEAFTEQKVRRGELVTVEDFKRYAEKTGYSLEKVLYATDWADSCLDDEALVRKKEAEESLTTV